MMNILVIGHKQHGKDEVGKQLGALMGVQYRSSSLFLVEKVIYPVLGPRYGYATAEECYEDRDNHRKEWYDLIREYNTPDGARLAKELLKEANIYVGMRSRDEYNASVDQGVFDAIIWVDASKRKPMESLESMGLSEEDADYMIDNNGTIEDLQRQLVSYADWFLARTSHSRSVTEETFSRLG